MLLLAESITLHRDAVSSELIQLFLKERPELNEEIEKSDDGWGFE